MKDTKSDVDQFRTENGSAILRGVLAARRQKRKERNRARYERQYARRMGRA